VSRRTGLRKWWRWAPCFRTYNPQNEMRTCITVGTAEQGVLGKMYPSVWVPYQIGEVEIVLVSSSSPICGRMLD
jgi:hypothetical protein